jgi:hypothetical protein
LHGGPKVTMWASVPRQASDCSIFHPHCPPLGQFARFYRCAKDEHSLQEAVCLRGTASHSFPVYPSHVSRLANSAGTAKAMTFTLPPARGMCKSLIGKHSKRRANWPDTFRASSTLEFLADCRRHGQRTVHRETFWQLQATINWSFSGIYRRKCVLAP